MSAKSLARQLQFWHFWQDLMVFSDGSLGAMLELKGFDIGISSNAEVNSFSRSVESLLGFLPESLRLQLYLKMSPDESEFIHRHENVSNEVVPEYQEIKSARTKFFNKNMKAKEYFRPEIYLFVRSKPVAMRKQKFFERRENFSQVNEKDFSHAVEKFRRVVDDIKAGLTSSGVEVHEGNKDAWFNLLFETLNPIRSEEIGKARLRDSTDLLSPGLSEQLTLTDVHGSKDAIEIGDRLFRVLTLKTPPDGVSHPGLVRALTHMGLHCWMSMSVTVLDQAKERRKLELSRRIAHSMAAGSKNVSDLESESKLDRIEGLLTELVSGGEKLISTDLSVIVWANDRRELDEKCSHVLKAFRQMNSSEAVVETFAGVESYLKALPGTCESMRALKMKTSNLAHLLPLYEAWRGNTRPVCVFTHREGLLFGLDPFAQELPNWNGIVFGGSGSGKSFSVAQLMLQFYGSHPRPRIIWIDNGASSKGLVDVLGGQYLDLNLDSGLILNMFDLAPGEREPSTSKIRVILAVLEQILKDDERRGLPKREKALLEAAILESYHRAAIDGKMPTLSTLKEVLSGHSSPSMQEFADILYSWTGNTAYGRLLDGQSNVSLSRDLVTIEVGALSTHSDLKDVLLLLLTHHIEQMARADLVRPYLCVVDEAERLFQTELARQFVITCYRTWRKYNSGIWSLSQNYKDFLSDPQLKDSLLPNTSSLVILRQRKIDWHDFQTTFDFHHAQVEAIKSLEIKKGHYSEFFYLQDEKQAVLRLVPEPLSYWICSSDARDKARIKELEEKTPEKSKLEILKELAQVA